ncbi:hypothetical protein GOV06_02990 [Candidatus Woesearchaeota archaeon]|nr:hypothetical protein [Candidatus Woesearchaeota archaeon]
MKTWLKGGLIGLGIAVLLIILAMIIPAIGFIISIPSGMLFCNVLYSCQGEWAGLTESFIASSILIVIISFLIGILIGKKV